MSPTIIIIPHGPLTYHYLMSLTIIITSCPSPSSLRSLKPSSSQHTSSPPPFISITSLPHHITSNLFSPPIIISSPHLYIINHYLISPTINRYLFSSTSLPPSFPTIINHTHSPPHHHLHVPHLITLPSCPPPSALPSCPHQSINPQMHKAPHLARPATPTPELSSPLPAPLPPVPPPSTPHHSPHPFTPSYSPPPPLLSPLLPPPTPHHSPLLSPSPPPHPAPIYPHPSPSPLLPLSPPYDPPYPPPFSPYPHPFTPSLPPYTFPPPPHSPPPPALNRTGVSTRPQQLTSQN
ncbi:hypothetical protein FKM82_014876 [Ascaphus truei]